MKRHLVAMLGIGLAAALGAASGCASDTGLPAGEETAALGEAMNPAFVNHYYRVQASPRWCRVAGCSGYYLTALDAAGSGARAGALDFSALGDDEHVIRAVREAPVDHLVLYGTFGAPPVRETAISTFYVRGAYRGMPGVTLADGDAFYTVTPREPMIECFAAPCDNLVAHSVESLDALDFTTLSVAPAGAMPNVDRTWLADRVVQHGAIVAGHLRDGTAYPTRAERVLEADQVFIRLPDAGGVCPLLIHGCPSGARATYTRGLDRCLTFQACVPDRKPCLPELPPRCAPGYTLMRWQADTAGCVAAACDPAFLAE